MAASPSAFSSGLSLNRCSATLSVNFHFMIIIVVTIFENLTFHSPTIQSRARKDYKIGKIILTAKKKIQQDAIGKSNKNSLKKTSTG